MVLEGWGPAKCRCGPAPAPQVGQDAVGGVDDERDGRPLGWSHEGAVRIVEATAGDPSVVWRLDERGTFTRFEDTVPAAVPNEYEAVEPADAYRTLVETAAGWELRDLAGGVETYDAVGRWIRTEDRNGNAQVASYDAAGRLEEIVKPDGRRETFAYFPAGDPSEGKLMTITLWSVLEADSKLWSYQWSGDDLAPQEDARIAPAA